MVRPVPTLACLALLVGCSPDTVPKLPSAGDLEVGGQPDDTASDTADTSDTSDPADTSDTADTGEDIPPWDEGPPPLVVLFIGDGMGFDHIRGAGMLTEGGVGSLTMETAPHQGRVKTASLSGYTDSAAAATTLYTGVKTVNGRVGRTHDDVDLDTLRDIAELRGLSVGVVSSDDLTGATPASILTHATNRYDGEDIVAGIVSDPADVMLGGGALALAEAFDLSTVQLVQTEDELNEADLTDSRPLVGLFSDHTLPYLVDDEAEEPAPALAQLTDKALDVLLADPDGALLVVEGARIDHASHGNRTDRVFAEVLAFDAAVAAVLARAETLTEHAVTVVVTADHECGGLVVGDGLDEMGLPDARWLWLDHTNRDVGVFAWGDGGALIDGERVDNSYVHAILDGALRSRTPVVPDVPRVPDGDLDDLGAAVATQSHATDFGPGFNQLDALRVTADENGLWLGIDGVFDEHANGVLVWLDLDHGAGTGVGAGMVLADPIGVLDRLIGEVKLAPTVTGTGFDAVVGQIAATYMRGYLTLDLAGVRQFQPPRGLTDDFAWQLGVINYDDGNVADREPARDAAAAPGLTQGGMEVFVPYAELWEEGLPASGAELGIFVTLSSASGDTMSNQALPAYATDSAPSPDDVPVQAVVTLTLDGSGTVTSGPAISY